MSESTCFAAAASFAQHRLLFLEHLEPGTSLYNIPSAWRIRGPLDVPVLQRSLDELVRRHEVLRTTFETRQGTAMQIIHAEGAVPLPFTDLSGLDDRESVAMSMVRREAELPFDLARGPLIRSALLKLGADHYILMITMHHVVSDLWSLGLLSHELRSLYGAFRGNQPSPLPELPIQYADYSVWQRERLQGQYLESELSFWRQYLQGAPETLDLPTDHPRPAKVTHHGSWLAFDLGRDLSAQARRFGRDHQVTQFMIMAAVYSIVLHRYCGSEDIVFGYPVYTRGRQEIEGLIGFFLNTLVLRVKISPVTTFEAVLRQVREKALDADAHQDLPFEKIVEHLRPARDSSRHPVFQVALAYLGVDYDPLTLPDLDMTWIQETRRTSKFELTLAVTEVPEEIECGIEYNSDLFERSTIERFSSNFRHALSAVLEHPNLPIGELCLVTPAERDQVLTGWNRTSGDTLQTPVHALFEEQAARAPDAPAIACGNEMLSYGELNARANELAHYLRHQGTGPESIVAVCMDRSAELAVAFLAILKAGAAYLPVDPAMPAKRLAYMVSSTGAHLVLTVASLSASIPAFGVPIFCVDSSKQVLDVQPASNILELVPPEHLAYCIYTSGSTGRPKAIGIPHGGLANLAAWHRNFYGVNASARATIIAGVSFDASTWEIWPYLTAGACLLVPDADVLESPGETLRWVADHAVTHCFLPTSLAELAMSEPSPLSLALKVLLTGGDRLRRRPEPDCCFQVWNHYGPTENSVVTTCALVPPTSGDNSLPPIGLPISNTQVYILDSDMHPIPIGAVGELYLGGAGLARGYLNEPELTAAVFVPNPFGEPGTRLYRSGDMGRYVPERGIEFVGRRDGQVKIAGVRVELGEVEVALAACPGIKECVVVTDHGGPADRLLAYVSLASPFQAESSRWRGELATRLPRQMVPSVYVVIPELPRLPSGKVDRSNLPRLAQAEQPAGKNAEPPRNAIEAELWQIWRQLLGPRDFGIHDDFFALGGQSLLAMHLVSKIRTTWNIQLPLRDVFDFPTIASLCSRLQEFLTLKSETNASTHSRVAAGEI